MDHHDVSPLDGYHPEIGLLLATMRDSTENWRKNLAQPPVEAIKGIDPARRYDRPSRNYTCTARWVIAHVLEHDAYTGGQAVALHELWLKMRA